MIETMLMKENVSGEGDVLLAGTLDAGWYGEVPASEFITGDALASAVGLTAGVSQHSDAGWLKFAYQGKVLYVSKKTIRHTLSWNDLSAKGLIYGQTKFLHSFGEFKVRCLKAINGTYSTGAFQNTGFDHPTTHKSEWNRLMYHISGKPFGNTKNVLTSEGISEGDWAKYPESEILVNDTHGNGGMSICQDMLDNYYYVGMGRSGVSLKNTYGISQTSSVFGWRPCLELVD